MAIDCDYLGNGGVEASYGFDDDLVDACGNYDMTGTDVISFADGISGRCIDLRGRDRSVYSGDTGHPLWTRTTDSIAISAWCYLDTTVNHYHTVFVSQAYGTQFFAFDISNYLDKVRFYYRDEGGNYHTFYIDDGTDKYQGQWRHVCLNVHGGKIHYYLDNSLISITDLGDNGIYSLSEHFYAIGSANGNDANIFDGLIDLVRIYNRSLTDDEIEALYYEPSGGPPVPMRAELNASYALKTMASTMVDMMYDIDSSKLSVNRIPYCIAAQYSADQNFLSNVDPFGDGSGVALWMLDGNLLDAGGSYDATVENGEVSYVCAKFNQGIRPLNDDPSTIVTFGDIEMGTDFTISLWFYSTKTNDTTALFGADETNDHRHHTVGLYLRRIEYFDSDISGQKLQTDEQFSMNEWHHVLVTGDENGIAIWVDGIKRKETSDTANTYTQTMQYRYYDGSYIDQLRVFNRKMTDDEIRYLYIERTLDPYSNPIELVYGISNTVLSTESTINYMMKKLRSASFDVPYSLGKEVLLTRVIRWT
ncbi:MAG: hypothetical protein DRI61_04145 [Chloroflexi bacterium]|nr:MAG: hypothetical protein DRI61_04145 [Chloroflexota bacterium]